MTQPQDHTLTPPVDSANSSAEDTTLQNNPPAEDTLLQNEGEQHSSVLVPAPEQVIPPAHPANPPSHMQWQQRAQANTGQSYMNYPYPWMQYPWYPGPIPGASLPGYQSSVRAEGGLPANDGANPSNGSAQTGGLAGLSIGANPYSIFPISDRLEPGDPLHTTNADGP